LTGLNTDKFNSSLEAIALIYGKFAQATRVDQLQEWEPGSFREWKTVSLSNRYFATGPSSESAVTMPFNPLVDPDGVLASFDEARYRHTAANEVGYFQRLLKEDGNFKYVREVPCSHF
jgi:hypothetical protein